MGDVTLLLLLCLSATAFVHGEDPYLFFRWNVTYGTISPLGVPQQAILINGQFPGPNINSTTNNNIVLNVFNNIDEPFLLTWFSSFSFFSLFSLSLSLFFFFF
jgi:L-ascorbate oxidase